MPGELLSSPLIEIAQALRDKRVTAQELVEAAIGRHERFGERLNAYSLWSPEQARVVAKAADAAFAAGVAVGPLQGLPEAPGSRRLSSRYPSSISVTVVRTNATIYWGLL
jgi:Asp-tRNA(Asn)/Glu-tRNA(Gln) amidotransferase A subunit family amidase